MKGRAPWFVWALLAAALVLRLAFLQQSATSPTFTAPIVAGGGHDLAARQLAAQGQLTSRAPEPSPFYGVFLALVYKVTEISIAARAAEALGVSATLEASIWGAKLLQSLLGVATCWLAWTLGRKRLGTSGGWLAAAFLAFYGPWLLFESQLAPTSLVGLSALVLILLFGAAERRPGPDLWLALGSVSAMATLLHPAFAPFLIVTWGWLIWHTRSEPGGWRTSLTAALCGLAAFALLSLPAQLFAARNLAYPEVSTEDPLDALYSAHRPACPPRLAASEDPERWTDDLGPWLSGLGTKAQQLLSSRELPGDLDLYLARQDSAILQAMVWRAGRFGFPWGLLLPLAVIGMVCQRRRLGAPLLLFSSFFFLSLLSSPADASARLPLIPALAVAAAAGSLEIYGALAHRRFRALAIATALGVATLALTTLPGPFCEESAYSPADFYYRVAQSQEARDLPVAAIDSYRQALAADSESPAVNFALAELLAGQGEFETAVEQYTASAEAAPGFLLARTRLAELLDRLGRPAEAIEHYRASLELDPTYAQGHRRLTRALLTSGRFQEALVPLERAAELDPRPAEDDYLRGTILLQAREPEQAAEALRRSLAISPSARAHEELGMAMIALGRYAAALVELEAAIALDPQSARAHDLAGGACLELGQLAQARDHYDRLVSLQPRDSGARFQLATALMRLGDRERAAFQFQEVLRLSPDHTRARSTLRRLRGL